MLFAYSGKVQIELIGVMSKEESVYSEVINKGGGLHHLGFFVSDFDQRISSLKEAGVEVIQQGYINTAGGTTSKFAYLDTVERCGINIELIETKLKGRFSVPQTKFMMQIGTLTGDVEKINV